MHEFRGSMSVCSSIKTSKAEINWNLRIGGHLPISIYTQISGINNNKYLF